MSTMPAAAMLAAVKALLAADEPLAGMVQGIHGDDFAGQATPHLVLRFVSPMPWHTFGGATLGLGWKLSFEVHVISQYEGDAEVLAIGERVIGVLNFATLTIAGWTAYCEHTPGAGSKLKDVVGIDRADQRDWPIEFMATVTQA